tara:strand:+ start:203 stop:322 length:120 start_codon:yes stop_codon:yes gene_type:complete
MAKVENDVDIYYYITQSGMQILQRQEKELAAILKKRNFV